MSTDDDIRQSMQLTVPRDLDLNWILLPYSFPYDEWQDSMSWVNDMTVLVYYVGQGKRADLRPTPEWFIRTRRLIALGWQSFATIDSFGKFLLFHTIDAPPTHIMVDAFLGDLPWAEAQDIYVRGHNPEAVEGPHLLPFDVPGADAAMKMSFFTEADVVTHALAAHYTYAFRKGGMDIVIRALFADLGLIHDGLPQLDEFVRGIRVSFGDSDSDSDSDSDDAST